MEEPYAKKRRAGAWNYFISNDDFSEASCKVCNKVLMTPGGCTSGLNRHLYIIHDIKVAERSQADSATKILDPAELISEMAAKDGISFHTIAYSSPIQNMLSQTCGTSQIPSNPTFVRDVVLRFAQSIREKVKLELNELKQCNKKVSLTMDEWTSAGNRRFVNVNVHSYNLFWNLGVIKIPSTFTSQACCQLLEQKLKEFGLDLSDVFGVTTDGASAMLRFVADIRKWRHVCMAYGIHLAVCDVFYKKNTTVLAGGRSTDQSSKQSIQNSGIANTIENASNDEEDSDDEQDPVSTFSCLEEPIDYVEVLGDLVVTVRSIVKMFCKSPNKSDTFQSHISENGANTLIPNCKTRWNSMLQMFERFWLLKDGIQKTLFDNRDPCGIYEEEFAQVKEIIDVLSPVKVAAESICRRDANLIVMDAALKFMMDKLSLLQTDFGKAMFQAIKKRVLECRSIMSDILGYLHYRSPNLPGYAESYFKKPSTEELTAAIKKIQDDFFEVDLASVAPNYSEQLDSEASQIPLTLQAELNMCINNAINFKQSESKLRSRYSMSAVAKEMQNFDATGEKGNVLKFVHAVLLTVRPCSVESERVFSSRNNFCTKLRFGLGNNTLDPLVFLRSYFLKAQM